MKKFFAKVKDWFIAHKPTKRRLIQLYAALLTNAHVTGFATGKIYTGDTKKACVPGLNCYSCPGAVGACPLGALQDSLAQSKATAPAYIFGILILFGLLLGRVICGFLCPFGLIQELLYKIRTPKLRKSRFTRVLSYFKYVLLVIVIAVPVIYAGIPSFCKYVCPAGTFEGAVSLLANPNNSDFFGMLANLFTWKFCVLVAVVVASVFIYRFFCRFICPLGAIYSMFAPVSLMGVKLDKDKCIDCGLCIQGCKMDIKHVGDHECIQCGECISVCPVQAISWKGSEIFVKNTTPVAQPEFAEGEKIALLEVAKSNATTTVTLPADNETAVTETTVEVETVTEETPAAEPAKGGKKKGELFNKIKSSFKKPRFVVEFVAWVLATVLLITALVCYNLPEKTSNVVPSHTLTTYSSAASGAGEKVTTVSGKNARVLYFWRTDLEESVEGMEALNNLKAAAESIEADIDIIAIHSIYKDDRDVQAFIDGRGWNSYDMFFAQDDMENNAYADFGGDISVPKTITVFVNADGTLADKIEGLPDIEKLHGGLTATQAKKVYTVGDYCPLFTFDVYDGTESSQFSVWESRGTVTVINFWYTTCDPCKHELPYFNAIYEEYSDKINMVAVHSATAVPYEGVQNWIDDPANVDDNGKRWADYSLTFAQDKLSPNAFAMLGGRSAYPITIILDAEGKITFAGLYACTEEELRLEIEKALA
ncbi:MAG: 4Fe-4S binding protein, partial [Clostridia bacterium]|nr:4Fe-4S binding protein [Clostridia bacterium]